MMLIRFISFKSTRKSDLLVMHFFFQLTTLKKKKKILKSAGCILES